MNNVLRKRSAVAAIGLAASLLTAGATLLSGGCGSGGRTISLIGTGSGSASYFGETYASSIALAGGQRGDLTMQVHADGTATGTLTIVAPAASERGRHATAKTRAAGDIVIATPTLSGTFNPTTGAISLTGSYTVGGRVIPISLTGTLPVPPSLTGGSLTLTVDGQTYTSTFGASGITPTPSPSPTPTPGSTPTPTPTPGATPTPGTGTVGTLTITKDSGSPNNGSGTLPGMTVSAEANIHNVGGNRSSLTVVVTNDPDQSGTNVSSLQLDIDVYHILSTETLSVGGTTVNASTKTTDLINLSYLEIQGGAQRSWFNTNDKAGGNAGQIVIEQLDASKVRVRFVNALVDPLPGSQATGKLRINGVVETTETPDYN